MSGTEHLPGVTEATDHFVRDQQDLVFTKNRLDCLDIFFRRNDCPTCALGRLSDHGGNGVRVFLEDQVLQAVGKSSGESFF